MSSRHGKNLLRTSPPVSLSIEWRGVHPEGIHPEGEIGGEVESLRLARPLLRGTLPRNSYGSG